METSTETIETGVALISVTIIVDNHIHNGIAIPKGATINVDQETAAWLLANHIIEG